MTRFQILGNVQLLVNGRPAYLGPAKQRKVLAALLFEPGRPVLTEQLIDRVWDGAAPSAVRSGLYSYVTALRRVFAQASAAGGPPLALRYQHSGYVLDAPRDLVDVCRFQDLVERARTRTGEEEKAATLREALALWHGEPFADLDGRWVARQRDILEQARLDAVLLWAQVERRLGHPGRTIARLRETLTQHPLVEPLLARLVEALYLDGRGAEALDCYAKGRQHLINELGAEPGPELRELHHRILRGESSPSASHRPHREVALIRPAQLPPDVAGFTGRAEYLAQLDALLPDAGGSSVDTAARITTIVGAAGVGKTTLAVHWARQRMDRFPDGQLYVNLRGFDPSVSPVSPIVVTRRFLESLDVAAPRIPTDLAGQVGLYRSLLAGRRMLVLLDNARDAEQVRPLLPTSSGCMAIVTSRNQLASLAAVEGARPLTLDLPTVAEARQLLANRLGIQRIAVESQAVTDIVALCARLPLALTIVAARAAVHPRFTLAGLAAQLREAQGNLDAFAGEDAVTDMRTVFSWSYATLSPSAAQLFRLVGLHAGPDIATAAVASLAGVPPQEAQKGMAELARAHLVTEHQPGRYAFHDLLRAYAFELAHTVDTEPQRRAALHRSFDHYGHTADAAMSLCSPMRIPITLPAEHSGVTPERPIDEERAKAWLDVEYPVLLAAIGQAAGTGFHGHAWGLACTLGQYFWRTGQWGDWIAAQSIAWPPQSARATCADGPTVTSTLPMPTASTVMRPLPLPM